MNDKDIEKITNNGEVLGLIVKSEYKSDGISFLTPDEYSLQLAYMSRPKEYQIQPHVHNKVGRDVSLTQEVLLIRKGKLRVDFYDDEKNYLESRIVAAGDVVLLATGGHGFEVIEPVDMIEVKQGPYAADKDKVRFEPVLASEVRLGGKE